MLKVCAKAMVYLWKTTWVVLEKYLQFVSGWVKITGYAQFYKNFYRYFSTTNLFNFNLFCADFSAFSTVHIISTTKYIN